MEAMNDALKYVVQARNLLTELNFCYYCEKLNKSSQKDYLKKMVEALENAEEALVRVK